jgi:NADPH:quinone reductase-like Zn-dependent oxidoreductase
LLTAWRRVLSNYTATIEVRASYGQAQRNSTEAPDSQPGRRSIMRAAIYTEYGPPEVLHLAEVPAPVPGDHEIMVKVYASTASIGDSRMRSFSVPREQWLFARLYLGIWKPRRPILGMTVAGDVAAVGASVTRFQPGDQVLASTFGEGFGGYAEYRSRA